MKRLLMTLEHFLTYTLEVLCECGRFAPMKGVCPRCAEMHNEMARYEALEAQEREGAYNA